MDNENPLRVAHVIGRVIKGGVESVVFNYYRAIDKSKIQFDFIIDEDSPYDIPDDILRLGCKVYKIPSYKHLPAYIRELKKIFVTGQYKIVHSHMNTLSFFTLFAAKRVGMPVRIAHSHSTAGKGEFARNVMKYALRPFSKVFPTHLFACSEYAGRWLFGNKAFDNGEITVIKNAIDTSKFRFNLETRERVSRELSIADKLVIGHVGRFMTQKNHSFLIDIFAELFRQNSESVLILVGDGELKSSVEEKVRLLGLVDCVRFLGARDDVHELYQAMDVFVLPSLYEGLPVVGVEAQCSGLPCVFSNRMTKETIVNKSSVVLSLDQNTKTWAATILQQAEITAREENSRSCSEVWDIADETDRLAKLYNALIGIEKL